MSDNDLLTDLRGLGPIGEEGANEIVRLQALFDGRWKDAAEAYLKSAGPGPDGTFEFNIQAGIVPLIAAHLAASFKAAGGENYVQFEVNHEELGPLMLTMQRRFGKMPSTVAAEQRARADAAEARLAIITAALRQAFPHFDGENPIDPQTIIGLGRDYVEMIGWETPKTEIEFTDQNGKVRRIVYKDADDGSGGWCIPDEGNWEVYDSRRPERTKSSDLAAIWDVFSERARQVNEEGWSIGHDDQHTNEEMAWAAACYAIGRTKVAAIDPARTVNLWPWEDHWWKPKDRRRDLVRAAALIIAEIERLDRAAARTPSGGTAP